MLSFADQSVMNSDSDKKIQDPICKNKMLDVEIVNNNDNKKEIKEEKEKGQELFTPYSLSSYQSRSNILTNTTAFLYETDDNDNDNDNDLSYRCHGSMSLLNIDENDDGFDAIYQYSDDTDYDDFDQNDNDNDNYSDTDSIPLIDRITPPPPLYINDMDNNADDEYEQYKKYHDGDITDNDNDDDDENKEVPNKNKLYLSIKIPSLKISQSTPIRDELSIFDICNTITPISSDIDNNDNDDGDYHYDEFVESDGDFYSHKENNDKFNGYNIPKMEKRFNWKTGPIHGNTNINNYYLQQHVQSLIVQNISR